MYKKLKVLVTGGSGFIGKNLIKNLLIKTDHEVFNIDKNSLDNEISKVKNITSNKSYNFFQCDLYEKKDLIKDFLFRIKPNLIINLAAETHVDRSIDNPDIFVNNNVIGTLNLLEASRNLYMQMPDDWQKEFLFYHAGTDEVYGSALENEYFNEESKYKPRSPYSASKASCNCLVQSWFHTYNLPIIIGNCSNNFGPFQFPEKLIPLAIYKVLSNQKIPLYGNGKAIRDWIYVDDHVNAILRIIESGKPGNSYCIGGNNLKTNNEIIKDVCQILDKKLQPTDSYINLISYVEDRPGHDKRYALDIKKIRNNLGWEPKYNYKDALKNTVNWYLSNKKWCEQKLIHANYNCQRLGLN